MEKKVNKKKFTQILKDIKSVKIQGANNVAKAALIAYEMFPSESTVKKLNSLRPTEPMMTHILNRVKDESYEEIIFHIENTQKKINELVFRTIRNGDVIFTHCHSTSVITALIYSKKKGKKFIVYSTETRPLYQGRKTAKDLIKNGIKTEMFVDSSAMIIFSGKQGVKKPTKMFIGADAVTKKGVVNKVGSEMFAKISSENKVPVYVVTNSWKFTNNKVKIEQRDRKEIWNKAPKSLKIKNFAFEEIDRKYVTKIISEFGILSYKEFLKKVS